MTHEREAIAGEAYNFVREHFTQKDNCRVFLRQIEDAFRAKNGEAQLAFNAEAKAEAPLKTEPLPDALTKRISRRPIETARFGSTRRSLKICFAGRSDKADDEWQKITDQDYRRSYHGLSDMRRGYVERFEAQKRAQQSGEAIFRLFDNSHFDGSAPAISVVVTLYNYRAYIQQCLKSLEDSKTAAIPGGIEVVIVNDASTDDSLKQAIAWQQNSRHPVRIVDKRFNTGLADARNIGLQLARAPYAFIMDADNMVFPRALEQLYTTIVSDSSAAVYSMLCRFQGVHSDREGLLSYFDWDPQMLVEHPYIDAMALFDRRQLIEIGGYDTELYKFGWFGWEDYDLWLRIAQAKFRVSFLPNILCLYRHHETVDEQYDKSFRSGIGRPFDQKVQSPRRNVSAEKPNSRR